MLELLLILSGILTVGLGVIHFRFPSLLDFETAIPLQGSALKEFRLFGFRHPTTRHDVRSVVWLMNVLVSFTLVSLGALDLFLKSWAQERMAFALLVWMAIWWFIRAACQLPFERSWKSRGLIGYFLLLGILHLVAAAERVPF